jgi:hypothetical protein
MNKMVEHTINWYKGEIFEAKFILAFGVATIVVASLFLYFGSTPNSKALFFPMLIVGIIFIAIGGSMGYSNQKKMATVEQISKENIGEFVAAEKKRVEDFQYLYPLSLSISAVCFVIAVVFLAFLKKPYLHADAIALTIFGFAFMAIDNFSKERSAIYYKQIINYTQQSQ